MSDFNNKLVVSLFEERDALKADVVRLTLKVAELYEVAEEQKQRIRRMEEAGDKLAEHHLLVVTTYDKAKEHVTMWTNAKDVKYERHTKNR